MMTDLCCLYRDYVAAGLRLVNPRDMITGSLLTLKLEKRTQSIEDLDVPRKTGVKTN